MLRTASIELMVLGCTPAETERVTGAFLAELQAIRRRLVPPAPFGAMPRRTPLHRVETLDLVQAKLCMAFTLGRPMDLADMAACRLAMALYGGSTTSRLFLHVREAGPSVLLLLVLVPELHRQHDRLQRHRAGRRRPGRGGHPGRAGRPVAPDPSTPRSWRTAAAD